METLFGLRMHLSDDLHAREVAHGIMEGKSKTLI